MNEKPILMCAEMVRATLGGRKTQTRRITEARGADRVIYVENAKLVPERQGDAGFTGWVAEIDKLGGRQGLHLPLACPYGQAGDRLWVREAHYWDRYDKLPKEKPKDFPVDFYYRADGECCEQIPECQCGSEGKPKWRPSIFMPRWASRITLEIVSVRVEHLLDISKEDAIAEGIESCRPSKSCEIVYKDYIHNPDDEFEWFGDPIDSYRSLWLSINGKGSWGNQWVWRIEFKIIQPGTHVTITRKL